MKVASYNVMSGGFDSYTLNDETPQRMDLLIEAVNKIDADFVSLIDTFRWNEIFSENELKSLFTYKHVYCIHLDDERLKKLGHDNGITVLTNEDVVTFETIRLRNRNAIKTTINHHNKPIELFSVYLDDLSEDRRLDQVNSLKHYFDDNNQSVIMGDLNTFSLIDIPSVSNSVKKILELSPKMAETLLPVFKEMQRAQVTKLLENNGFYDTNTNRETTAPSPLFPIKGIPAILRIDYIYARNLTCQNFQVYKDPFFDTVSDHYPISVEVL